MSVITKSDRARIKGCLEVKAKINSRMGLSDTIVPEGSVGYVMAHRPGSDDYIVYWPTIKREHKGDWRSGAHKIVELEPTGNRG